MTFWKWSRTAASNATADSTCPFPENMAASALNDGTRGMMAAAAKFRDDIAGAIVTGGTSTAYSVSSYQGFDTLAHLDGQVIAFSPHATNGATVTLNVDGLGAKPLRAAPATELLSGTIIQGTPYVAVYNNTDGVFYLRGFFGNPFNMPLAGGMDYWGTTVPNSAFAFPIGQAISRTTYASLFAIMGTTFGNGDGSTTFNLPDKTGRVSAMVEASAARLTSTYFGNNSTILGAAGGLESETLTLTQLPGGITAGGTGTISESSLVKSGADTQPFSVNAGGSAFVGVAFMGSSSTQSRVNPTVNSIAATSNNTGASGNGSGASAPHNIVQPTIICNYIIRII